MLRLTIDGEDLALIRRSHDVILLGIITGEPILRGEGRIRLRITDATVPGHVDWVRLEPTLGAMRGFSLAVKHGVVVGLYAASRLNPDADGELEPELIDQLKGLLPLGGGVRVWY